MPHDRRPYHEASHPVHITLRVTRRAGNLRRSLVAKAIVARMRVVAGAERFEERRRTFRVAQYSIQNDHLHLIVEASSAKTLSKGIQGLLSPLARVINRTIGRRGRVFSDRFHQRALATPREVRNGIRYVLTNHAKHHVPWADPGTAPVDGLDPCSSAWWFDGWRTPPPATTVPAPVAAARTWLLRTGWRRHGLLDRHEHPAHHEHPVR